ncbi:hypothetical protein [Nostoc sp. NMS4]|uniref:hypothetical protein n=1 Tax=Nostoc sp. NMS4 TaxID=2815390 RepID=UPI0025FB1A73|nr:hypothetical protein [Nostoc sp. NMS4]MBN3924080.1 hypothetical protein [Nostoc sp. NMS4]
MTRTAASSNEAKYKIAKRRIESFSKRFGEPHFYLACHAAFPLALTPDLLYRLWANFQQDVNSNLLNIPWIAVADLLLSNLCNEVGYELYEIDWEIRNELLNQLKNNTLFGQQRVLELSEFLLAYMREQLNSSNPDTRDFAQAQKWTALAYAQPHEAAREIACNLASLNIEDGSEWIRLTSLVETLADPLAGYEPLLVYVSGMKTFTRGNVTEAKNLLSQIMDSKDEIHVAGVKLLIPNKEPASNHKLNFRNIAQIKNKFLVGVAGLIFGLAGVQIISSFWLMNFSNSAISDPVTYQQVTLSSLILNNQGKVVTVSAGEKLNALVNYFYNCPTCQPTSSNQIIVGIAGEDKAQACIYNGGIKDSGSAKFTLTAPNQRGTYYIRFRYAQAYGCNDALGWWKVGDEPPAEANIGLITVK